MTTIDLIHQPVIVYASLLGILFAAGTTKGLIGIGMPIVAVPLLNLVIDLPATVSLLSVPLVLTNIPQAVAGDPVRPVLARLAPIFAGAALGVVAGVSLLVWVAPSVLGPLVGALLVAIAGLMLCTTRLTVPPRFEPVASPVAGVVGGLAGGLAALPGPFVFMYLLALGIERDRFVQYSSMFLAVVAAFMFAVLFGKGVIGWREAAVSAVATLPILGGMWVGTHIRQFVSAAVFRKVILGTVLLSGFRLLIA